MNGQLRRRVQSRPGREVPQLSSAEQRAVDALASLPTVAEDFPGLHAREGVLDASTDTATRCVVGLLPCRKLFAWSTPVRDDQPGPEVAAISVGGDPVGRRRRPGCCPRPARSGGWWISRSSWTVRQWSGRGWDTPASSRSSTLPNALKEGRSDAVITSVIPRSSRS